MTYQAAAVAHQPMCNMSAIDGYKIEQQSHSTDPPCVPLRGADELGGTDHECWATTCSLLWCSSRLTHWLIIVRFIKSINWYINQVSHQTWINLSKKSSNLVQKKINKVSNVSQILTPKPLKWKEIIQRKCEQKLFRSLETKASNKPVSDTPKELKWDDVFSLLSGSVWYSQKEWRV